jgi:hypothetical protein
VSKTLSYADAVRILGGDTHPTVDAIDRLTGGLLLWASAVGGAWVLSLFDAKAELARLSRQLVTDMEQVLRHRRSDHPASRPQGGESC